MQTVVGVLRGGPSREHEVSLKSGASILANLSEERYVVRDIYIDRNGRWHNRGKEISPEKILRQTDVILNGLRGDYGEDGEVQKILELFGVPYAGTNSFGSYISMHKMMAKIRAEEAELQTPKYLYVEKVEDVAETVKCVVQRFHQPVVVKPARGGSSIGVSVVGGYAHVLSAIENLFDDGRSSVIIEEYIRGREATVGVIDNLRGESIYVLPVIEIIPQTDDFYSYDSKYSGKTKLVCPGFFSRVVTEELQIAAKKIHRTLGLRHYSRSDFIVSPRGIYYLETNTLPELTNSSLFSKALASVGVSLRDFLTHLVNLALSR